MRLFSAYLPGFARAIVYMLQSSEYRVVPYLKWLYRAGDFRRVATRRELVMTRPAKLLMLALRLSIAVCVLAATGLMIWGLVDKELVKFLIGLSLLAAYPVILSHLIILPLVLGEYLIVRRKHANAIKEAKEIFSAHPGIKIAIAGSYGKTSLKNILEKVLSQTKKVAATPGNQNVPRSHAKFARSLDGDEDIVLIEYGEEKPGDIEMFMSYTMPNKAVITGLAPNHLDHYKTLEAVATDLLTLQKLPDGAVYINGDNDKLRKAAKTAQLYDSKEVLGWQVMNVRVSIEGVAFELVKQSRSLKLHTSLLGRHMIGPLGLAAVFGLEQGLSPDQIKQGIAEIQPVEHRMQPRKIAGAWVIDDTYNGNIEGMRAGLQLLAELKTAGRKIYVTPGLVDQGSETRAVHLELGWLIAGAKPHEVVLMQNSVTELIEQGLAEGDFGGKLTVIDEPLEFYTGLEQYVAAGDVVLMQNDWTDNYA